MTRALADAYDECCVLLLRATSSPAALIHADYEAREDIPAYDASPTAAGRDELRHCPGCGCRFWSVGGRRTYCADECYVRAYQYHRWRTDPGYRARRGAAKRVRRQRIAAARRLAGVA